MERKKAREMDPHDRLDAAARRMVQLEERLERLEAQNKELLKTMKSLYEVQDQQDTRIEQLEEKIINMEPIIQHLA